MESKTGDDFQKQIEDVLLELKNDTKPGKHPEKLIIFLEAIKNGQIDQQELASKLGLNKRRLASFVANINTRYLDPRGLHIGGEIVYHLKSK